MRTVSRHRMCLPRTIRESGIRIRITHGIYLEKHQESNEIKVLISHACREEKNNPICLGIQLSHSLSRVLRVESNVFASRGSLTALGEECIYTYAKSISAFTGEFRCRTCVALFDSSGYICIYRLV